MITIVINRDATVFQWEVNGIVETPPATCAKLLEFGDSLAEGVQTLVCSDALAELVLLRVLRRIREKRIKPERLNLWVIYKGHRKAIEATADGDLVQSFPGGFFEESLDELF